MHIFLEKDILHDLEKSAEIEWLERNKYNLYSSSTCIGMNTRREHGLFVVPDNSLKKQVVLLSKFEESVFIENKLHEISTNSYQGGVFPTGYKYLSNFKMNPFPCFTYEIENRKIEKTVFLLSDRPMMVVRYELKNQGIPVNLIIKPFLADRFNTELTRELQGLNTDSYVGNNFVRWALKQNMPEVYVYYTSGEFASANLWYKNFCYSKDVGKYSDSGEEHLFNPGFFQATLFPYQALDLYISTNVINPLDLNYDSLYQQETQKRRAVSENSLSKDDRFNRIGHSLKKSLKTIYNKSVISVSVMDNLYTTRDIIFSMPGFFLLNKEYTEFKKHYLELSGQISEGLLPVHSPLVRDLNHFSAADLSLWFINLGYMYFLETKDLEFFENGLYDSFRAIIEYYEKGTLNNIYVDKDGLVFSGNKTTSTSWMPLVIENNEVLRFGKLLEVNALWYNALKILEIFTEQLSKKRKAIKYEKSAANVKESFTNLFIQSDGTIADFITPEKTNTDFRVNQIVPLALPFSVLDDNVAKRVLNEINDKLLTRFGLRSAKINKNIENHDKNLNRKTMAYFNGAVWPWTMDLYVTAALKYSENKKETSLQLKKHFDPLLNLVDSGLINYLPEAISYNDSPHIKGAADYTPSLASTLWGYSMIFNEQKE